MVLNPSNSSSLEQLALKGLRKERAKTARESSPSDGAKCPQLSVIVTKLRMVPVIVGIQMGIVHNFKKERRGHSLFVLF